MKQGRADEADAAFARAHELAPQDMKTLAYWSTLHEGRGDLKRAGELLDQAEAVSSPADSQSAASQLSCADRPPRRRRWRFSMRPERLREKHIWLAGECTTGWVTTRPPGRTSSPAKRKLLKENPGTEYRADAVESLFDRCKAFLHARARRACCRARRLRPDTRAADFRHGLSALGHDAASSRFCAATRPWPPAASCRLWRDMSKQAGTHLSRRPSGFPRTSRTAGWRTITTPPRCSATTTWRAPSNTDSSNSGTAFFTDKMPFNEIYLPLIKMAFPNAKIVRVVRHPLDVCVSMLSNNMTHGFHCGYRIEDISQPPGRRSRAGGALWQASSS